MLDKYSTELYPQPTQKTDAASHTTNYSNNVMTKQILADLLEKSNRKQGSTINLTFEDGYTVLSHPHFLTKFTKFFCPVRNIVIHSKLWTQLSLEGKVLLPEELTSSQQVVTLKGGRDGD